MAAPQTASQPSGAQRPLEAGDIAPPFRLAAEDGEIVDPASDLVSGKPLLLLFRPKGTPVPAGAIGLAEAAAAADGRVFQVSSGQRGDDLPEGFGSALDADGSAFEAFKLAAAPVLVLIAPNRHIAYIGAEASGAAAALARIMGTRTAMAMTMHPPVLIVPDVLSRADCQRLINVFAMQGQSFVDPGHGTLPPGNSDYKQRIPEYGRKDRIDHWIRQPDTVAFIDDRLGRRLFPEIQKSFQYRISRREVYRIGSYEGERGGELHGHRDNTKPMVAHRRFACSINLNTEQFEGGELRYPEFGNQLYRPETGAAIVFSSSLFHEPMHVTKGRRFVLLAFLYGES